MHQLQETESLIHQWKALEREPTVAEEILDIVKFDEWISPDEIYRQYTEEKEDPVTKATLSKHLKELERLGDVKKKGACPTRKYKRTDKPIQHTREDYSSPLSEGLPDFMKQRIRKEVREVIEEEIDRVDQRIEERLLEVKDSVSSKARLDNNETSLIYDILDEDVWMKTIDIIEAYQELSRNPLSSSTVKYRLRGLAAKGLIKTSKNGRSTKYRKSKKVK
jgi:DNA-binding transcriptional ArsR family regulator